MTRKENRFVAFIDIAGYKNFVKKNPKKALAVIKEFFKNGFYMTENSNPEFSGQINGIFISDCGIIWTKDKVNEENLLELFKLILRAAKNINERTIENEIMNKNQIMLTTSIAYGEFYSIKTVGHGNIQKNLIYGQAYIDAYLDNSNRLNPGLCRIVIKDNFPEKLSRILGSIPVDDDVLSLIRKDNSKMYYYWNCRTDDEIDTFKDQYQKAIDTQYEKMFKALSNNYGYSGNLATNLLL